MTGFVQTIMAWAARGRPDGCVPPRELRRWHPGALFAARLRLPTGAPGREVTAVPAVALVRGLDDPRRHEVLVPRPLTEARRSRAGAEAFGWPNMHTHSRRHCPCPACRSARTKWRGYAAVSRATSRPGRRAS